jgi:proteic killer suppression protein
MLLSFGDKTTEDIFHGMNTRHARSIPQPVWGIASRKLDFINAAGALSDLASPPGNHLEALKGDLSGYHSIRINSQYRIIFQWKGLGAAGVRILDYHS